jgi:tryptophan halogenase
MNGKSRMNQGAQQKIRHIVIVGGGTSGWMTAAMMSRVLKSSDCRITVIEPPGPRGIGVGEASIPSLVSLLKTLGADEVDMMQKCEATYKLGIQFCDWLKPNTENWHPFGVCGAKIDGRDLFPFWLAEHKRAVSNRPYHSYSLHWAAAVAGKSPHSFTRPSPIAETQSYAFHFNAESLAGWLRDIALAGGVSEVVGSVANAAFHESGDVSSVVLTNGHSVTGDFFVDCSGFQSVLMHKALNDPFNDWGDHLLCDRAVAFKIPGRRMIPPYTKSQALSAGWMWHIPLAHHVGLGYVYSSKFISDAAAWAELQSATPDTDSKNAIPRFLKMRVGRQSHFWNRNVLAIGLSAGFLEPLESSGIHLSQVGIETFLRLFPQGTDWSPLRDHYNNRMKSIYDEVRDFVQLHYSLSQRTDTPFWIAAREAKLSTTLKRRLDLYDDAGTLDLLQPEAFPETSYFHLLTGNDRLPRRASALALTIDSHQIQGILTAINQQNQQAMRDLPLHEEVLKRIHLPLAKAS